MRIKEVNEMPKCACCGILIPCNGFKKKHHGRELIFCEENCYRVYKTYKFPTYKEQILEAERKRLIF